MTGAQRDAAEQHDFRELRADFKTRKAILRFAGLDGSNPFLMLPVIVVTFERIARDGLRNGSDGFVLFVVSVFLLIVEPDKKLLTIIIRGKDFALVADDQAGAIGNFAHHLRNVGGEFARRFVAVIMAVGSLGIQLAAVLPPQRNRIQRERIMLVEKSLMGGRHGNFPRRKLKTDFGAKRIRLGIHAIKRECLNFRRIAETERTERHIDSVTRHVTERAGAKILPAAPVELVIDADMTAIGRNLVIVS